MILTPRCHYTDNPEETDERCARCGRLIQYTHIVIGDDGAEIPMGIECVKRFRREGQITGKEARRGRYDWGLSDVREEAHYNWYCSSIAHAS